MRNTNSKVRCEKRQLSKCKEVVKTYNEVQYAFADVLEGDATIKEFICNYLLSDFPRGFIEKLEEYIHYYNNERISLKLKGMSPVQYRAHSQIT